MTDPRPSNGRLSEIWAESSATPEEIIAMAEELRDLRRHVGKRTLLDEFAMAALPALIPVGDGKVNLPDQAAALAYCYADSMMEKRR